MFQFSLFGQLSVIVSGYDAIYECTVTKGYEFGSRPNSFKRDVTTQRMGILTASDADGKWRFLRKTAHQHLKQFGDGMSRLEGIIQDVAEDMFATFRENVGKPYDPRSIIFDTALNSVAFLITGERLHIGDDLIEKMRLYDNHMAKYIAHNGPPRYAILNAIPWVRFFGIEIWQKVKEFVKLEHEIWDEIVEMNARNPDSRSLCKTLMEHCTGEGFISDADARRTSMNLLQAAVSTTSITFYAAVNILAHHKHVYRTLQEEIRSVFGEAGLVSLTERHRMPYTRAFVFELLRSTSVVCASASRCPSEGDTLQGHFIPKGTKINLNLWGLHNDPAFWKDPEVFRPERFLDADGGVVPADHPHRKHLMPFGAGPRVCLGETLAVARLFLWITTLVSRFTVEPAPGNEPSMLDTKEFVFQGLLVPRPFEVIFREV